MKPLNKNIENTKDKNKEDITHILKTIAVYEAKSAIAKLKLLKYLAEKGVTVLGNAVDKAGEKIEKKLRNDNENKV